MTTARPIVIGGGPAGTAAAIHLLRAGARPIVYERNETVGNALCGGFLSWTTLRRLEELGISRDALGGHTVRTLRLTAGAREWHSALPAPAMGVSRHRLDSLMLARARELGAEIRHDTIRHADNAFRTSDGVALMSDSVFLATGKHDLRGMARERDVRRKDPFLGLRMHYDPAGDEALSLSGAIEMHLFGGGYAGLVLQENGRANLCMAVRKSRLAKADGSPQRLVEQLAESDTPLARRLAPLLPLGTADAIGNVPYGWRATDTEPGLFRLGDQAGVIPSLAGEGMGIALASARLAVATWASDGPQGALRYQRAFASTLWPRLSLAGAITALGTDATLAAALGALSTLPGVARLAARLTRV